MNEWLAEFRAQYPQYDDMADADLLRALHSRYYSDLTYEDFKARLGSKARVERAVASGGPSIGPAGPTAQPMFPKLPPMVGGALDALIAYGTGVTLGAANAIPGVERYNAELQARNPITSRLLGGAGAAMSIPTALAAASAARMGAGGAALLARGPVGRGAGLTGGALGAYHGIRKLLGN